MKAFRLEDVERTGLILDAALTGHQKKFSHHYFGASI